MSTLFIVSMMSCSSDKYNEDPYFYIEDQMTAVTVDASGILQANMKAYTIRSNRPWTITQEKATDWLHVFADEGDDDGIFDIWIDKNPNFTSRTGNLIFKVDGQEQPVMFRVDQKADVPGVTIVNAAAGYTVPGRSSILKVPVTNNVNWEASLSASDWAAIDSVGKDTVYIKTQVNNTDDPRCVTLKVVGTGTYSSLSSQTIITQSTVGIIINEHFNWMQLGDQVPYYQYPEVNSASWSSVEKNYGWTTIGNSMYGGRGYLKIGKTNYGGDLVSPKFQNIGDNQTMDLVVSFKAIGYVSSGGTKDTGVLKIIVLGAGAISGMETSVLEVNKLSYPAATMYVTVYPNSSKLENGVDYNPWEQSNANFSFLIKGATNQTQIMFVGGTAWGPNFDSKDSKNPNKNRILFDDIKVMVPR